MEMLLYVAGAFLLLMLTFRFISKKLFPVLITSQFHSMRVFREVSLQQRVRHREVQIIASLVVALACGFIACYFTHAFFLPVLVAVVAIESVWVILTYDFRPQLRYEPTIKSHLLIGTGAALVIGVALCVMAMSSIIPILITLACFWLAWFSLLQRQ